jgi:PAS domain S-box-containing protein
LKEGLEGKSDLIFVGGGIAIAPYISVIRYLFGQNTTRNIYLINVKKDPGENLYTEELKAIAEKNGNFTFIQTFGRPDQTLIAQANAKLPQALWYVTGPQGFVDSVYTFLAAAAVNPERVNYEEHYPTIGRFSSIQISDLNLESSSLFKLAIDKTSLHVVITDINGYVLYANEAAEKLTGYTAAEILGNTPRLWGGLMSRDFYKQLWATKKTNQKPFIEKITNRRKNGEIYIAQATISPIINSEGKTLGFIGTEEDITNTEQARIDLEKFNKISVNRELKMVELKNKIAALEKKVTE